VVYAAGRTDARRFHGGGPGRELFGSRARIQRHRDLVAALKRPATSRCGLPSAPRWCRTIFHGPLLQRNGGRYRLPLPGPPGQGPLLSKRGPVPGIVPARLDTEAMSMGGEARFVAKGTTGPATARPPRPGAAHGVREMRAVKVEAAGGTSSSWEAWLAERIPPRPGLRAAIAGAGWAEVGRRGAKPHQWVGDGVAGPKDRRPGRRKTAPSGGADIDGSDLLSNLNE